MSTQEIPFAPQRGCYREPIMALELASDGPVTVIVVSGEVDMSNTHLLTEFVEHVARGQPLRLVLDLAKVTFFCADGVSALLHLRREVTAEAGQFILRDPSPITRRVLTITRVLHQFAIQTSASTA